MIDNADNDKPASPPATAPASPAAPSSAPGVAPAEGEIEEVYLDARPGVKEMLGQHGLLYMLLLGWNFGLIGALIARLTWRIKVTNQRLVIIRGLVSQREEDIPLYRGTDCAFEQTVPGRMFGTGTVTLIADDATSPNIIFPCRNPRSVKEKIRHNMIIQRRRMKAISLD